MDVMWRCGTVGVRGGEMLVRGNIGMGLKGRTMRIVWIRRFDTYGFRKLCSGSFCRRWLNVTVDTWGASASHRRRWLEWVGW